MKGSQCSSLGANVITGGRLVQKERKVDFAEQFGIKVFDIKYSNKKKFSFLTLIVQEQM